MATIKITALPHLASDQVAPGDVFIIDDISGPVTNKITVSNLTSYLTTVQGNLHSYAEYANSNAAVQTAEHNNLVAVVNEVAQNNFFNPLLVGNFTFQEYTVNSVSSIGSVIYSTPKTTSNFAKLLINVEDLTYGQFQSSEILLIHDGSEPRIVEYGIVYTSTNPLCTYEAYIDTTNVNLKATAVSADNRIRILKIQT